MSNLEELIERLCPDGVEYKPLEKCCEILDKKRKPVAKSARISGEYPYYGANGIQDYVSDYIFDGEFVLVGEDGSVITDKGTPVVTWASGKIWVNNHAHIISEINGVLLRYIYYYLQTVDVTIFIHGNIPKLTGKDFKSIKLPVPPLEVQREIVRILDNFTFLTTELAAELAARQKQYEYYRDKLLTPKAEIKTVELGEVCTFVRGPFGGALKKEIFKPHGYAVYEQQHAIYRTLDFRYFIDKKKFDELERFSIKPGDMIVSCSGTIGKTFIIPEDAPEGVINQALLKLTPHDELNVFYLQYFFENTISKELNGVARGGAIKNVPSVSELKAIKIPVPSLDVQERLVQVLDNFDAICSDLNIGLPAEIEARQKQYEYYRDKLLTFKELKKEA